MDSRGNGSNRSGREACREWNSKEAGSDADPFPGKLDVNPCTGDPAIWTSVAHGVFHVTAFADGTVHVRATFNSRFTVDTIDPTEADFSGHAEDGFSFSGDGGTAVGTSTFTPILKGTDGSKLKFHYISHFTANASGEVTVEFDRAKSNVTCL